MALAILLLSALVQPAAAHEIRPIIATVSVEGDEVLEIELSLNLEAAMAGIGPEHADTSDSPAAPVYDRLRSLPPDALGREFDSFAPSLIEMLGISFGNQPARLSVAEVSIPPVGDTSLPRISQIGLAAPLPEGADGFTWHAARRLGDSVLRLRASVVNRRPRDRHGPVP